MTIRESVYIGGPMRGLPRFGFDQFDSMAHWLRRNRPWTVFSPAEHDRETWADIEDWPGFKDGDVAACPKFDITRALSWDLARVAESQHLVLLPGWEDSSGAKHERYVAELTGSSIWLAYPLTNVLDKGKWVLKLDMSREDLRPHHDQHPVYGLQPTPTPVMPLHHRDPEPVYAAMRAANRVEGEDIEALERLHHGITTDKQERKNLPITSGVLDYFPDALLEVAKVSKVGNDQHNPGEPLHWAKEKSSDEADALVRHLLERGTFDVDGTRHSAKVAWRALALLQRELDSRSMDAVREND